MDSENTYPTPNDILETKEKNSLLYIALNKNVFVYTKNLYIQYEGILKKIQGNFILLEKEEKKKFIQNIVAIDEISSVKIITNK